ncbi:N,N-dimethylformamidase beta subunit family domain-containing protein [Accumulibacter sp.]|uniref:N,N-dimethylformamidase beta subunit family domain-containing protein n=1 Tax=Accumulibacter sp. TaxID=2053492 RepID=UPI0025E5CD4A|nr:N,N-dimethylformamidase beta subunit family domain-containing protein [Accumulibacter sp.]
MNHRLESRPRQAAISWLVPVLGYDKAEKEGVQKVTDDQTFYDDIEGYCGRLSYGHGDRVSLHVSTRSRRYDVRVERWGAARELVWSATGVAGAYFEAPADADAQGCRWPIGVAFAVAAGWRSGFYLVTLTAHDALAGRDVAHAGFVVRGDPNDKARALYVLDTNTWHAYNTWGGCSLYTGGHKVSHARPFARGMLCRPEVDRDDRKARPRRWGEEPDVDGAIFQRYRTEHGYPAAIGSTGWFSHARRFVEWAERAGYRLDYAVSTDLEQHPDLLVGYDLALCVGHDEYWSAGQRQALDSHVRRGGHLANFSGNTSYWQVRLDEAPGGTAMVCYKYTAHKNDPVIAGGRPTEMTGMWADPLVGRPEWELLGASSTFGLYHRFGAATPRGVGGFVVYRADHWMFAGTGLTYGDVLGADDGIVGYETLGCPVNFDDLQLPVAAERPGLPQEIEIVAFTPSSNLAVGEYPASISALTDQGDLEFIASRIYGDTSKANLARVRHGNSVMLTCRPAGAAGGEVVTIGTVDWVFGLATDPAVARVTANVLDHLLG